MSKNAVIIFPRLAIHTGVNVVVSNKHPEWEGTIVLQHNETTATMLKYGSNMTLVMREKYPLLSTFQSYCEMPHWANMNLPVGNEFNFFGQTVAEGQPIDIH